MDQGLGSGLLIRHRHAVQPVRLQGIQKGIAAVHAAGIGNRQRIGKRFETFLDETKAKVGWAAPKCLGGVDQPESGSAQGPDSGNCARNVHDIAPTIARLRWVANVILQRQYFAATYTDRGILGTAYPRSWLRRPVITPLGRYPLPSGACC